MVVQILLVYKRKSKNMQEIKSVNRQDAIVYLIPVLKILSELNIKHEITENHIIIDIPKYIPVINSTK